MNSSDQNNYGLLISRLDEFIRKYYKNRLVKGSIYCFTLTLAVFFLVIVLEYIGQFSIPVRTTIFYTFIISNLYFLIKYISIPLFHLNKLGKIISHEQAASIIGNHFLDVKDKLLNTLQLSKLENTSYSSTALINASINQKIEELKPIPFTNAINISANKKYFKYAIIPLILLLTISITSPKIIKESTHRLIEHDTYFEKQAPFQFVILNDELKGIQQRDFLLELNIEGETVPEDVYIFYNNQKYKMDKGSKVEYSFLFKKLQKDVVFQFLANEYTSKTFALKTIPNPLILNFDMNIDYPAYISQKDEVQKNADDVTIPAGTKISWDFKTQNTSTLKLTFNDTTILSDRTAQDNFQYTRRFFNDNAYSIFPSNEFLKDFDSLSYHISVIPDLFPSVQSEQQPDSLDKKIIYFTGNIQDDYGFNRLTFNYIQSHLSDNQVLNSETISLPISINKNSTFEKFYYLWNINEITFSPGDIIEYYFEVWDNDGIHGSKSAKSGKMIYKAPTLSELTKITEQNDENLKEKISNSIEEAKRLQEEINKTREELLNKNQLTWNDKKKIENLLKKQRDLQQNIEEIQKNNKQNNQQKSEYQDPADRILEKQKQLQELAEELLNEETKKLLEEMEKLMEEFSNNMKLNEELENLELSNQDIEKELDRMLALFKQLEFEQKLKETINSLENLAEKEKELSQESMEKDKDINSLKDSQEKINEDYQEIKEGFKSLEDKKKSLEQMKDFPVEQTQQQQQSIQQEINKSSEQLSKNNKKQASKHQKDASQQMQQLAQDMQDALNKMQAQSASEDLDDLRVLLENLLKLSFDQEDLINKFGIVSTTNPQYVELTQKQNKLKDDAKMIEDSLFALSKRVVQIKSVVNREIGLINNNMGKSIEALEERRTSIATTRQQYVMTSINNMAVMLSEVMDQLQKEMANSMPGLQQCQKPGSKSKGVPKLSELQQELNLQIEQLKENMGKKPKDGQKGNNSISPELAKAAAKQAAIRKELQKLNELNQKEGKKKLGDLNELSDLMDKSETEFVNKFINQGTLMRQKEIMTRLLEAEKALREQELSEERESKESINNENNRNIISLEQYKRLKTTEIEFLRTIPPSLIPYYKNKVTNYFQNIEKPN